MRYLYYIIGIFILATAAFALFYGNGPAVEVSGPAIVINDRVITEKELENRMAAKPHDMTEEQYIDSLIMQELLIQEALKQDIHKEESFRRSVESFYEQSLVKILLDRKYRDFAPEVTDAEIEKYQRLAGTEIALTKRIYPTMEDAGKDRNPKVESMTSPFVFLSDDLRFILLQLEPGQTSAPRRTDHGVVTYRLDGLQPLKPPRARADTDKKRIKELIADQKQKRLYDQWAEKLRQSAEIRRPR